MKIFFNILLSIFLLGFVFLFACKKTVNPTTAEIRVVSDEGEPVAFAEIILTCDTSVKSPCDTKIYGTADEYGVYKMSFDGAQVLKVFAEGLLWDTIITGILPDTNIMYLGDSVCVETCITVLPEQLTVKTITLYDCN